MTPTTSVRPMANLCRIRTRRATTSPSRNPGLWPGSCGNPSACTTIIVPGGVQLFHRVSDGRRRNLGKLLRSVTDHIHVEYVTEAVYVSRSEHRARFWLTSAKRQRFPLPLNHSNPHFPLPPAFSS